MVHASGLVAHNTAPPAEPRWRSDLGMVARFSDSSGTLAYKPDQHGHLAD
ncbi:MAG: hypothetical protein IPH82_19535 [Chloroflexi bacterium]|nr:hypothetical protein [Chloroflexota bacterium]